MFITNSVLQFLNLFLVLLDVCFLSAMLSYLWRTWGAKGTSLALGLIAFVGGHTLIRSWNWFWDVNYYIVDKHFPNLSVFVYFVALIITIFGLTMIFRAVTIIFSRWIWLGLISLITSVAFLITYFL